MCRVDRGAVAEWFAKAEMLIRKREVNRRRASPSADRLESADSLREDALPSMRKIALIAVLAVASATLLAGQSSAPQGNTTSAASAKAKPKKTTARKSKGRKKSAAASVAAPLPAQQKPPVPATLMNSSPVKPNVTLQNGQLTIDAPNSSLSDVLSSVHRVTGATLEGPTPGERIAIKLGPGSPEQVLNALLQGTAYDYVIVGTPGAPENITRIVLATSGGGEADGSEPGPADRPGPPGATPGDVPHRHGMFSPRQPPETSPEDASSGEDEQAQPQPQPEQQQPDAQQQQQPAQKSPEDLFKELQQLGQQPNQNQQSQQPK